MTESEQQDQFQKMVESWENPPPLHPDLLPYLERSASMPMLRHPLVFAVPYTTAMNYHYNQCYEYKIKGLEESRQKGEWGTFIFLHERPYRWNALIEIMNEVPDEEYWSCLGSIWSDTENLWQVQSLLHHFLSVKKACRDKIMDNDEKKFLESLPETITIFRGHQSRNRHGYSYSLSYWRARWFAARFQQPRQGVLMGTVKKEDVIGVFLGRNEYEIAVDPCNVKDLKPVPKLRRQPWMDILLVDAASRFKLNKNGIHGLWHWDKVERNAIALCKLVEGADLLVCRLFAILHDAERLNENDDPEHGHRAASYVEKRLLGPNEVFDLTTVLSRQQIDILLEAITEHNDGNVSEDPTIGVCWDSDRLDLSRVGIVPDPKMLSTQAACGLVWRV